MCKTVQNGPLNAKTAENNQFSSERPKSTEPRQIGAKGYAHIKQLGPNTAKLDRGHKGNHLPLYRMSSWVWWLADVLFGSVL